MDKSAVDYSLYLVTDSTEAILGQRDLLHVVDQALSGGVTVVQYRDKTSNTGVLVETARQIQDICQKHKVPLIINDRVDVALAVGCAGVHLGQDDMDISTARKLLGPDKIIGATVSSISEASIAVEAGADYLGIGTLYATTTKKDTKSIIGIKGIRNILHYLGTRTGEKSRGIKSVCIGGVNLTNCQRIFFQLYSPSNPPPTQTKGIDGVAVVSALIACDDPCETARRFQSLMHNLPTFTSMPSSNSPTKLPAPDDKDELHKWFPSATQAVSTIQPISHNMTNLVVQNFAANVAICVGASPIMSNNGDEAPDLARLGGGLVINMGTSTPETLSNHRKAIIAYNAAGNPIVLDPVGAGATSARKEALEYLMASGYFDLIKGNEAEIKQVARASGFMLDQSSQQRGVDSGSSSLTLQEKAYLVERIARRERNVVLMTGATDLVSDGETTYAVHNGHSLMGDITGSGCALGTTLSAYLAANRDRRYNLLTCVAGILHYDIAGEMAGHSGAVEGPGTFVPAFLDALSSFGRTAADCLGRMKVELVRDIPDCGLLKEVDT